MMKESTSSLMIRVVNKSVIPDQKISYGSQQKILQYAELAVNRVLIKSEVRNRRKYNFFDNDSNVFVA
jgi:hypothetical protein